MAAVTAITPGSAGPLREGKGTVWEGGVRTPFVARWPGKIPAGSVQTEPTMTIDLLPTVAKIVGADLPKLPIDGRDVGVPLRCESGGRRILDRTYRFYFAKNELQAVRRGKWKLILPHQYRIDDRPTAGKDGIPGKYKFVDVGLELYDLETDVGESTNVANTNPEVVKRLMVEVESARNDLGDSLTGRTGSGVRRAGNLRQLAHPDVAELDRRAFRLQAR